MKKTNLSPQKVVEAEIKTRLRILVLMLYLYISEFQGDLHDELHGRRVYSFQYAAGGRVRERQYGGGRLMEGQAAVLESHRTPNRVFALFIMQCGMFCNIMCTIPNQ